MEWLLTDRTKQEHKTRPLSGGQDMTMLLTAFTMLAFAGVYALLMVMLGERAGALMSALSGRPAQPASRRLTLA
jgi:hypothetical protein